MPSINELPLGVEGKNRYNDIIPSKINNNCYCYYYNVIMTNHYYTILLLYSSIDTHSRVPLLTNSGGSDYINANFITVTMVINSGRSDNINANFHTVSMVQLTGVHNSKRRVPFSYYYGLLKEFTNIT